MQTNETNTNKKMVSPRPGVYGLLHRVSSIFNPELFSVKTDS